MINKFRIYFLNYYFSIIFTDKNNFPLLRCVAVKKSKDVGKFLRILMMVQNESKYLYV